MNKSQPTSPQYVSILSIFPSKLLYKRSSTEEFFQLWSLRKLLYGGAEFGQRKIPLRFGKTNTYLFMTPLPHHFVKKCSNLYPKNVLTPFVKVLCSCIMESFVEKRASPELFVEIYYFVEAEWTPASHVHPPHRQYIMNSPL